MQESRALEFRLVGERGGLNSKPYFLAIGLLKDREPRRHDTRLRRRPPRHAGGANSAGTGTNDDFGVAAMGLEWKRTFAARREIASRDETRRTAGRDRRRARRGAAHRNQLRLFAGAARRGFVGRKFDQAAREVTDRCALGPQRGHSRWLLFQIVSPDELFYEILMRQREQRTRFNAAYESEKLQHTRWPPWPSRKMLTRWRAHSKSSTARCGKWPTNST